MARYAAQTDVTVEKSKSEIERTLTRYGADQFMYGWEPGRAVIGFRMRGRQIRLELPLPKETDFVYTESGRRRKSQETIRDAWEQGCRQRWRALALVVKAKLEAVECEITTFEEEFLAHILLPDNSTVGQFMVPQIEEVYGQGTMPSLLPGVTGQKCMPEPG